VDEEFEYVASTFEAVLTAIPDDKISDAMSRALGAWNTVSSASVAMLLDTPIVGHSIDPDEYNVLAMSGSSADRDIKIEAFRYIYGDSNVSCDIVVYAGQRIGSPTAGVTPINWSIADPAPADGYRLQDLVTHELGHCLGFDEPAPGTHTDSIMAGWSAGAAARTLAAIDEAALRFLYP
jgi:hypothetical protein